MNVSTSTIFGVFVLTATLAIAQNTAAPQRSTVASEPSVSPSESVSDTGVPLGEPLGWNVPKYPKRALKSGLQGTVLLALDVDEEGNVTKASPLSGDPELVDASIAAVRKWKYVPYDVNGKALAATTRAAIRFSISKTGHPVSVMFETAPSPDFGQVFKISYGIRPPKVLFSPPPAYSKKAREDKYQGVCILDLVVGPDGKTYDIKVSRALGEGLDEKAVEAVRRWTFQPATKDGKPVAVFAHVEVTFHLH